MRIGAAYKTILIEKGISARKVVAMLGVTTDSMRKVFKRDNPNIKSLVKYCDALDIKVSYLIARAEELEGKQVDLNTN